MKNYIQKHKHELLLCFIMLAFTGTASADAVSTLTTNVTSAKTLVLNIIDLSALIGFIFLGYKLITAERAAPLVIGFLIFIVLYGILRAGGVLSSTV